MKSTLICFVTLSVAGALLSYHAVGAPDLPDKKKSSGKLQPKVQELKKKARKKSKDELAAEAIVEARFFKRIRTKQIAPSMSRTRMSNRYREAFEIKSRPDLVVDKKDSQLYHGTTVIKGKKSGKTFKIKYRVRLDKKQVSMAFEKEKVFQTSWRFLYNLPSYEEPFRFPKESLPPIKDKK